MLTVRLCTTNSGKKQSLVNRLQELGVAVVTEHVELIESRSMEPAIIAQEKALEAFARFRQPVIAIDAGFFIPALNGFPKTQVNFVLDTIGIEGILDLMAHKRDRRCEFRHALAYADQYLTEPKLFERTIHGMVAEEASLRANPRTWSSLDRIFVPVGCSNVEAELCDQERAESSARHGRWYGQFAAWLRTHVDSHEPAERTA